MTISRAALAVLVLSGVGCSGANAEWIIPGLSQAQTVTLTDPSMPKRFKIAFSIANAAVPPGRRGTIRGNVTAKITASNGSGVIMELGLSNPAGQASSATLSTVDVDVPVSLREYPFDILPCDDTMCGAEATLTFTSQAAGAISASWAVSAVVLGDVGSDKESPPPGATIGITITPIP